MTRMNAGQSGRNEARFKNIGKLVAVSAVTCLPAVLSAQLWALHCSSETRLSQKIIFKYEPANRVSSGKAFRFTTNTTVTPATYNRPFSQSLSLTPLVGANYAGPILFGGWESSGSFQASSAPNQVSDSANGLDPLLFRFRSSDSAPASVDILVVHNLASPVDFTDVGSFGFAAYREGDSASARAVIKADDSYYIGAGATDIPRGAYPEDLLALDIGIGNWLSYDPLTSIAAIGSTAAISSTAKISAVGFHFKHNLGNSTDNRSLFVQELQVEWKRVDHVAKIPPRSVNAPKYADVCFCSRWVRGSSITNLVKYHATRMEWCYTTSAWFIASCKSNGIIHFMAAVTGTGAYTNDHPDTIRSSSGDSVIDPNQIKWGDRYIGCVNQPGHKNTVLQGMKDCLNAGADGVMFDDYLVNFSATNWGGCYCNRCIDPVVTPQSQSLVRNFYNDLKTNIISFAGKHAELACNNVGAVWDFDQLQEPFTYGCGELWHGYAQDVPLMWSRYTQSRKAQIVTLKSSNVVLNVKTISLSYACGQHCLMPYDVYIPDQPRFFGNYADYAHITGFVRAVPDYLNDYEDAFANGAGIEDKRYGTNDVPATVVNGNNTNQTYLFVRSKPDDPTGPKIIHVIEWKDCTSGYQIKINLDRFFNTGVTNISAKLYRPQIYDEAVHDLAQSTGNFSNLREFWYKSNITYEGRYATIPMAANNFDDYRPWGFLVIESGDD